MRSEPTHSAQLKAFFNHERANRTVTREPCVQDFDYAGNVDATGTASSGHILVGL